jgi:AcrR family transcriptional regulator
MAPRTTSTSEPRETLSAEQIVAAGVRVADAEGLDGLSMRRVATELGAGAMSLYRHVSGKDDLVVSMTKTVLAGAPYPDEVPADWREAMRTAAVLDWGIYQAHPWMILTLSSPRYYGADTACLDWMVTALRPLTGDAALARTFALSLWSFVQGMSLHRMDRGADTVSTLVPTEPDFHAGLEVVLDGMQATAAARARPGAE